jgi:uncharacterized lipoprotein YajG
MKKLLMLSVLIALLAGCSAPKPPQPTGEWTPVNQGFNHAPVTAATPSGG